jgi:hypothetical protein
MRFPAPGRAPCCRPVVRGCLRAPHAGTRRHARAPRAAQAAGAIAALAAERGGDADYASPYSQQAQRQGLDLPWWQKLAGATLRDGRLELGALRVRGPWLELGGSGSAYPAPCPSAEPAMRARRARRAPCAAAAAGRRWALCSRGCSRTWPLSCPVPCVALGRVVIRARGRMGAPGRLHVGRWFAGLCMYQRVGEKTFRRGLSTPVVAGLYAVRACGAVQPCFPGCPAVRAWPCWKA